MSLNSKMVFAAATLALAIGASGPAWAQAPMQPFVGAWKLNIPKSHMGFDGPGVVTPMRGPTFTWIFEVAPENRTGG